MNTTINANKVTTGKLERVPRSKAVVNRNVTDSSYEAWKKANGLDCPLNRAEYVAVFNPCGL